MDEQRDAASANSADRVTSAGVPPETEGIGTNSPRLEINGFTIVRVVLGVMLLVTAVLKMFDPSPNSFSGLELLSSPRWQMAAIEVEALLGLWLLAGGLLRLLWLSALFCFLFLASVSLYMGIEGQSSCGCFGAKLSVSPWYALGLDLAAVAFLISCRPPQGQKSEASYSLTIRLFLAVSAGSGLALVMAVGVLTWTYGSPYEVLLHIRGWPITIEPSVTEVGNGVMGSERTFSVQLSNHRDKPVKII